MKAALLVLTLTLAASTAAAHGIGSTQVGRLVEGDPIAVAFTWSSGGPVAFAPFKVFGPGDDRLEYQNGRTDRVGRVVFLPDRDGPWRIEVQDDDDHRASLTVEIGPDQVAPGTPVWQRWLLRLSLGANVVLGLWLVEGSLRQLRARRARPTAAG
jgi:nickel transport protein